MMKEVHKRHGVPVVKNNIIDNVVSYFSPVKGVERRKARTILAMTGSYKGSNKRRRGLSEFNPLSGSADYDTNHDLPTLRDRSRDLVRNNPIATGSIHTAVQNVVGTGLRLNARIDIDMLGIDKDEAKIFESRAERGFKVWMKECDIERTLNFLEMQDLIFRSSLENGDCVVIMPYKQRSNEAFGLKLQLIESDRLSNPNNQIDGKYKDNDISGGVELDSDGAPIAYHIMTTHPGEYLKATTRKWLRYPTMTSSGRRSILHLFRKLRVGQHRGVPYLAPIIEPLKQLERYTDAELMAAVISGMFTIFIESESGEGFNDSPTTGITGTTPAAETTEDENVKLDYGAIVNLTKDEKISFADPKRPNDKFDPFFLAIMRQVGMALEIPYEVLIKQYTTSYTAARAAIIDSLKFYMSRRAWLVHGFCNPVYEAWMTEAVARGYLYAPGFLNDPFIRQAYLGAQWIGPTHGSVDPVKDVRAAEKRIELTLTTTSEECAAMTGGDWDQKVPQIQREKEIIDGINGTESENKDK